MPKQKWYQKPGKAQELRLQRAALDRAFATSPAAPEVGARESVSTRHATTPTSAMLGSSKLEKAAPTDQTAKSTSTCDQGEHERLQGFLKAVYQQTEQAPLVKMALSPSGVALITTGLTNAIHPILHREQFLAEDGRWYHYLEPTLRFASRLIGSDPVVKHLILMVDGELRRDTEPWGAGIKTNFEKLAGLKDSQGQPLKPNIGRYPKPGQETVNQEMRDRAAQILMETKDLTRIILSTTLPDEINGCAFTPHGVWEQKFDAANIPRSSIIALKGSIFQKIIDLYKRRRQGRRATDVEWDLQIHEIILGTTILHELFHAVENAHNRPRSSGACETFCGDCPLAECGFAVVAAVLGGIPTMITKEPTATAMMIGSDGTSLLLADWPSSTVYNSYRNGGHRLGSRSVLKPLGFSEYLVDMAFVEAVLTDEYWDVEVPKNGSSPLHVPKRVMFTSKMLQGIAEPGMPPSLSPQMLKSYQDFLKLKQEVTPATSDNS